jgi:3-isopropylmalate dehydrogenase
MLHRYDLNIPKVADSLQAAVDKFLDGGYRTGDIWTAGHKKVGCSECGKLLLESVSA